MANRSDFNTAALPRQYKRMLHLTSDGDIHHDGAVRRLFIDAHRHQLEVIRKRHSGGNFDMPDAESEAKGVAIVAEAIAA
jgi:hypothetical protein